MGNLADWAIRGVLFIVIFTIIIVVGIKITEAINSSNPVVNSTANNSANALITFSSLWSALPDIAIIGIIIGIIYYIYKNKRDAI